MQRHALAGDQRNVELGIPLAHGRIDRHAFAGAERNDHAGLDLLDRKIGLRAIRLHHERAARREPDQVADGLPGPFAHHVIQRAPDQQKEQQRDRGIEIGVRAVLHRLVDAHAEGEQHAERDRNVHVGPPVPERAPSGAEEYPPRIGQRRQRNEHRQPVEQVARLGFGARPDRHRKQHDIAGGKARDRKRPDQFGQRAVIPGGIDVEQMGLEAHLFQGLDKRRRAAVRAPPHRHAFGRQVGARAFDARKPAKRLLDGPDTCATVDRGHGEVGLANAVGDHAAREQDFFVACARR